METLCRSSTINIVTACSVLSVLLVADWTFDSIIDDDVDGVGSSVCLGRTSSNESESESMSSVMISVMSSELGLNTFEKIIGQCGMIQFDVHSPASFCSLISRQTSEQRRSRRIHFFG